MEPVIEEIIEEETEDGVLLLGTINGGAVEEAPPL